MSPTVPSVHDFAVLVTAYEAYWQDPAAPWRPCPQCARRRAWHSTRPRWVHWTPGQRARLGLRRLRCRPCHTVETVFPPWLLPYEELPVASLDPLLQAAGAGASWATVAAQTGPAPLTVRRRWRRWGPQGPGLRQRVLQQATRWGLPLTWPTWRPPAGARSADWGWLGLAWAALVVVFRPGAPSGMGVWAELGPTPWPAAVVPARTHLGRRLRAAGVPP